MNDARILAYDVAVSSILLAAVNIKAVSLGLADSESALYRRTSYELEKLAEQLRDERRAMTP